MCHSKNLVLYQTCTVPSIQKLVKPTEKSFVRTFFLAQATKKKPVYLRGEGEGKKISPNQLKKLLINFRLISNAQNFVNEHQLRIQVVCQTHENVHALCTCSS